MGCRSLRRGGVIAGTGEMQPPEDFCKPSAWGPPPRMDTPNPPRPPPPPPARGAPTPPPAGAGGGGGGGPRARGRPPAPLHFSLDSQGALAVVYISINVGSRL